VRRRSAAALAPVKRLEFKCGQIGNPAIIRSRRCVQPLTLEDVNRHPRCGTANATNPVCQAHPA
jgi:hypothetical protein